MRILLPVALLACSSPAFGQEFDGDPLAWTATVQGGGLIADSSGDQSYFSAGLSRDFGDRFTLGLTGSYTNSQDEGGGLLALPSRTYQARLSADAEFGALSVGGYASYGRRTFSSTSFTRRNGTVVRVGGSGPVFGAGGSLAYDVRVGNAFYLSPQASLSYDRADIARVFAAPGVGRVVKDEQNGVTGTVGVALQRVFGDSGISLSAAYATSSNAAAYRAGSGQAPILTALGGKQADDWLELGVTGTLALNPRVALTGSAMRTLGFAKNDGTSIVIGARTAF